MRIYSKADASINSDKLLPAATLQWVDREFQRYLYAAGAGGGTWIENVPPDITSEDPENGTVTIIAQPATLEWIPDADWGVSLQASWTINRIRSSENTEIDFAKLNACLRSVFGQMLEVELIGSLNISKMSFSVNGEKREWVRPKIESLAIDLSLSAKQISDHQLEGLVGYTSAYLTTKIVSSAVHRPTLIRDLSSASDRWIEKLEEIEAFKNAENVTFYFPKDDVRSLGTERSVLSGLATGLALAIYQNPLSITPQGTVVDQVHIAKDKLLRCYQE